jgi:hypothetical protein
MAEPSRAALDRNQIKLHAAGGSHFDQHLKTRTTRSTSNVSVENKPAGTDLGSRERNAAGLDDFHKLLDKNRLTSVKSIGETLSHLG